MLLSFLHSCEPPIIHGNLTSDTIFIQHNGLIKIGSGGTFLRLQVLRRGRVSKRKLWDAGGGMQGDV